MKERREGIDWKIEPLVGEEVATEYFLSSRQWNGITVLALMLGVLRVFKKEWVF